MNTDTTTQQAHQYATERINSMVTTPPGRTVARQTYSLSIEHMDPQNPIDGFQGRIAEAFVDLTPDELCTLVNDLVAVLRSHKAIDTTVARRYEDADINELRDFKRTVEAVTA